MQLTGNTMLITGGGSGIGLALAEEFKRLGNNVIVAGRSQEKLERARSKGLKTLSVDMTSQKSIQAMASEAIAEYPALNVVIHNAGIMINEKIVRENASQIETDTVLTNVLGPMHLTHALLHHFLKQKSATIMTVTSGLATVPLHLTPSYCASKAAIHSYTQSLRYQLRGTSVVVQELIPPYVRTSLMGSRQAEDPNAMPLDEYVAEVISILRATPDAEEIAVKRVMPQRTAGDEGPAKYREFFERQNETVLKARQKEWDAL